MHDNKVFSDLIQVTKMRYFTNRETEVDYFLHMIENAEPKYRILMLYGLGGIGKSMIINKYQQLCNSRDIPYLSIDCSFLRTAEDFFFAARSKLGPLLRQQVFYEFRKMMEKFDELLTKVQQIDEHLLLNNLDIFYHRDLPESVNGVKTTKELSVDDQMFLRNANTVITSSLVNGINDYSRASGKFILFLDTFETVTELFDQWIRDSIIQALSQNVRVVISGRNKLSPGWNALKPISKVIEIVMFNGPAVEDYLAKRGIANKFTTQLFRLTAGHPLSLALTIDLASEKLVDTAEAEVLEVINEGTDVKVVVVEAILESILNRVEDAMLYAIIEACAVLRAFDGESILYLLHHSQYLRQFLPSIEDNNQPIILELQKRLRVLEIQKAKMGFSCPPHIEMEIEEIKQKLSQGSSDRAKDDALIKTSHWAIDELRKLSFTIVRSNGFALHDLVREYIVTYLKSKRPDLYKELNKVALDWYYEQLSQSTSDEWYRIMLEILHHTLALDESKGTEMFARMFVDITLSFRTKFSEALVAEMKSSQLEIDLSKDWLEYAESRLLLLQSNWSQRERQLEKMVIRIGLSPTVRVWVLADLGSVHRQHGRTDLAIKMLQRCIALARQINDLRGLWEGLFEIAKVYRTTNDWDDALVAYDEALQISQKLIDIDREAKTHLHIGAICNLQGKWKAAEASFAKAMDLFRQSRNEYGVARTFFNLGWAQSFLGTWEAAETNFQTCIDMSQKLGATHSLVSALLGMGNLSLLQGAVNEAQKHLLESLKISQDLNYRVYMGNLNHSLGRVNYTNLRFDQAIKSYEKAIELFADQGDVVGAVSVKVDLAIALKKAGQIAEASTIFQEAMFHLKESGSEYQLLYARLVGMSHQLDDATITKDSFELIESDALKHEYHDLASQAAIKLFESSLRVEDFQDDPLCHIRTTLKYASLYNFTFLYTQCKTIGNVLKSLPFTEQQKWLASLKDAWPLSLEQLNLPNSVLWRARNILFG